MADPRNEKYLPLNKQRRFEEAAKLVVYKGWTQLEAAVECGVSRPRLGPYVGKLREQVEGRVDKAKETQGGNGPLGLQEKRRVPPFWEFEKKYFGHIACPDCDVRHEPQDFHRKIIEAEESGAHRIVTNMPPFHAKTTTATIKKTVHRVIQNPNDRNILLSWSDEFAKTFRYQIDQIFTNHDLYVGGGGDLIDDWGPFRPEERDAIWNQHQLYVTGRTSMEKDPTIQILSYGGQIYGRRADRIVADDIASTKNQSNPQQVADMIGFFDKMANTRVGKKGLIHWIGTRVHPGDIYGILKVRQGYVVLSFSAILDDSTETVLWPEHMPYDALIIHRDEMSLADFQLVFQNVDVPGLGASFTQEMMEAAKDHQRVVGQYDTNWRLVAGLDLAGGSKDSGYTAGVLRAIDLRTGKRFLVDNFFVKGMRAPLLKKQIFEWSDMYPIYEWRVENNGLQAQLVQYNEEIIRVLAQRGIRVVGHNTNSNKWDPQFGVESQAPLYHAEMISIPWGNQASARAFQPYCEQMVAFPMGRPNDLAMADWFSELGCRDLIHRAHMPMFDSRMKVPERIKRRRHVVDFSAREVKHVPRHDQTPGRLAMGRAEASYRRLGVGRPIPHQDVEEVELEAPPEFVNVAGTPFDWDD
jgi:hypothetical protein